MARHLGLEDILTDRVVEEDFLEVPLGDKVFRFFFIIALIFVALVGAEIVYLGGIRHDFFAKRSVMNMSDSKIQPAPRGVITDRFGNPLVRNEAGFNVFLSPRNLPSDSDAREKTLVDIATILHIDLQVLKNQIAEKDWSLSDKLFLTKSLSQEQIVSVASQSIPGLLIQPTFQRVQEIPYAFSHVIGYTGLVGKDDIQTDPTLTVDDEVGKAGLEAYYDKALRGINGEDVVIRDAKGTSKEERVTRLPEAGDSLKTFIDRDFQEYFYNRLKRALDELGRNVGVGIALNPQNGEVLALVNIPGFKEDNVRAALTNPFNPLFNRAVSGLYNPGSTIKPLVGVAALTEGIIDPLKKILSVGFIELPNPYDPEHPSRFLDWRPQGWVDMRAALARSSNVYFYEVGGGFEDQKGLGIAKLKEWWSTFGLDKTTGIDLPHEESGFLPDPEWKERRTGTPWRIGDTYNVSIGQGDLVITPIELLDYIGAIANGGIFYTPRIVDTITDASKKTVFKSTPSIRFDLRTTASGAISLVSQGMRDGVKESYGTSHILADLPLAIAAKTGTAQIQNNAKTNAFFVGFAPYDKPELAILVLIENSREGSLNTVPVARDIFSWYYTNRLTH